MLGALCVGYVPPGPVARAFINDTTHRLVGIMGPNGSGKTSSCPVKAQLITRLQPRNKHDGVIRSNGYVIRPTYPDLWGKTIKSWKAVFPETADWPFEGQNNRPAKQVIRWDELDRRTGRRQRYEMIVNFVAIADANIESFARGLLATWIWLNEADTFPGEAVDFLLGRLGRFPEPHMVEDDATPGFGCVMCDFNAPNSSNWTYSRLLMERLLSGKSSNAKCYVQPSGLAPDAENPTLRKLDPLYYSRTAAEMEDWQVKRFIMNLPGYARTGEPVFGAEWDTSRFVIAGEPRRPNLGQTILIGVDGGLNAAAVLGGRDWRGQVTIFKSLVTPAGSVTDAATFGERVRGELAEYPRSAAVAALDPAAFAMSAEAKDNQSWATTFSLAAGIPVVPARSNAIAERHRWVRNLLKGNVGAEPTLMINETGNEILVEGFIAGYRVKKLRAGEDVEYQHQPDKNHSSHVHDAAQYFAGLAGGDPEFVEMAISLQADLQASKRGDHHDTGAGGAGQQSDW